MKIIYKSPNDAVEFDLERYYNSLNKYGEVSKEAIETALKEKNFDPMHYSVLVEIGVDLLPDEVSARRYYDDHRVKMDYNFERLRRITGYLVGTLDRWNDGKKAEEAARVKHNVGQYTPEGKAQLEAMKQDHLMDNQDEYHKTITYTEARV